MDGIKFKLLEVNLSTGEIQTIDVTESVETYFGGNGLGNKLIWDLVPQRVDPLSPENILHIGVGPITGLVGTKVSCSFISPLTGWAGEATVSGYIGDEIMRSGFNAGILIRGKADKPVYLYVYNDRVEIREASDIWGNYLVRTENTLRDLLYHELLLYQLIDLEEFFSPFQIILYSFLELPLKSLYFQNLQYLKTDVLNVHVVS